MTEFERSRQKMEYGFIFDVALILATTKILGMATHGVKLPQVVGALLAGLILGPACLGILHETEFIEPARRIRCYRLNV